MRIATTAPTEQVTADQRQGQMVLGLIALGIIGGSVGLWLPALPLKTWATDAKPWLDVVSTIDTLLVSAVGVWFVWEKLLRTRDFGSKVQLTLTHGAVSTPGAAAITHWVSVEMTNVGRSWLKDHTVTVQAWVGAEHENPHAVELRRMTMLDDERETTILDIGVASTEHFVGLIPVMDGPTVTFGAELKVPADPDDGKQRAERWSAFLTADRKQRAGRWCAFLTAANQVTPEKSAAGAAE